MRLTFTAAIGVMLLTICTTLLGQQDGSGTIQGRIVDKANQKGLANTVVQARNETLHKEAVTDSNGEYKLQNLPDGHYLLVAIKHGIGDTKYVTVRGGSHHTADLQLERPAFISGHIFASDNSPAKGASVSAWRLGTVQDYRAWLSAGTVKTNREGAYEISGLPRGSYILVAYIEPPSITRAAPEAHRNDGAPHNLVKRSVVTYYPGDTSPDGAMPIQVKASAVLTGIDVKLIRTNTFCTHATIPGAHWAAVSLFQSLAIGNIQLATTSLKPAGRIRVCGLSSGDYHLTASTFADAGRPYSKLAEADFTIDQRDTNTGIITPQQPVRISGHVEAIGNRASTLPASITLDLAPYNRARVMGEITQAKVSADGDFVLERVFIGRYTLHVYNLPNGYYLKSATFANQDVTGAPFETSSAELDITLGTDAGSVRGSIFDTEHQPVADALVTLTPVPLPASLDGVQTGTAHSDQNGNFTLATVPPGQHLVFVLPAQTSTGDIDSEFLQSHSNAAKEIAIEPVEAKSVTFELRQP